MHFVNYREYLFSLNQRDIIASAFAHPCNNDDYTELLKYISENNFKLMFALDSLNSDTVRQMFLSLDTDN